MRFLARSVAVLGVAVGLVFAVVALFRFATHDDRRFPTVPTTVVIPRGMSGRDVARTLADRGVIANAALFSLLARLERRESAMRAGEYRFAPHRSAAEVLTEVVTGRSQTAIWLTIPEGYTAAEIAVAASDHHLGAAGTFARWFATHHLEGYLFPDTYLVPTVATPATLAAMMTTRFRAMLPADARRRARKLGFTVAQVVTIASLVEREAKLAGDRPRIAGVYYNRLKRGMPLQVDATIEYAFARHKERITYADLALDSPYNTYRNRGLPPTPIANPGRASLDAAFFPEASDYLYYVADGSGRSFFARTLGEHNANVAKYVR